MINIRPAVESEAAIIGALLLDHSLFDKIKDKLCPSDFSNIKNQKIFECIKFLQEKYGNFDIPMILDHINYDNSEDSARLYSLANDCCSTENIQSHANIVKEKSFQMQLAECANELKEFSKCKMNYKELLIDFLQETSYQLKSVKLTHDYLNYLLLEVSKAFVSASMSLDIIEDEEQ